MLEKKYIHQNIEKKIYDLWEDGDYFSCPLKEGGETESFSIMIPPPNVTGSLHMGHALNNTLQDIIVRYQRMLGKDVLWQPGTDHAGIATQMVVERKLMTEEGLTKDDIGRDAFIKKIWDWKEDSGSTITNQLKRLGASCDWKRERFTMDGGLNKAVIKVFNDLYNAGLIYKDKRLVNWDTKFQTAISDLEVQQVETEGNLWYIDYYLKDFPDKYITVATTRPETLLGDVAVAVNPEDERYSDLIGKTLIVPIIKREIKIISDNYAKLGEGTGAVKITPAHDFNDFEVGKRNNLDVINIFDKKGNIVSDAWVPEKYRSLDRFKARVLIVQQLETEKFLNKIEKHSHTLPYGDRSGTVIEPFLTDQWYVNAKELSAKAVDAVKKGETKFVPKQWEKTYFEWMNNIQPWCISRQLWWGHQIPVWYGPDNKVFVALDEINAKKMALNHYGNSVELTRDSDVLDTWFSSGLWPFSTLGWPEKTIEFKKYYNTDVLVTAFDIIFFWVARMMMMGLYFTKEVPFKTVYIHALVRDEKGQKMSKSKGNVIDPLNLIGEYGADSLRFTLASMAAQGRDVKLSTSRVEGYRNFITKLWNLARFIDFNNIEKTKNFNINDIKYVENKWIVQEFDKLVKSVSYNIENYKFNEGANDCYRFTWHLFCDWYVEIIKITLSDKDNTKYQETSNTIIWLFSELLKVLHPFIPFVTEELWQFANNETAKKMLIANSWPKLTEIKDEGSIFEMNWIVNLITEIRSLRSELNISPSLQIKMSVKGLSALSDSYIKANSIIIKKIARISEIIRVEDTPDGTIELNYNEAIFAFHINDTINIPDEISRLNKEINIIKKDILFIEGKLLNKKFTENAPEDIIAKQKIKHSELIDLLSKTEVSLKKFTLMNV
ncbi:MAG: valine--tRNA ligase [Alphaproteobacteria bacterium]|jgi:valyl-tRNA synthetase|tara:strand:+ start:3809 stop:6478 length:2670 start_codon:yes stop_codon:yes gene_type:complete